MTRAAIAGTPTFAPVANTAGTSATLNLATPAGAAKGETLLAVLVSQATAATADVGLPAGWSRVGLPFVASSAAVRVLGIFVCPLDPNGAPPPSSYAFTSPSASTRFGGMMVRIAHGWAVQPLAQSSAYGTLAGAVVTAPAVSSTEAESLYLLAASEHITAGQVDTVSGPPTGMTEVGHLAVGLTAGSRSVVYLWQQAADVQTIAAKTITWGVTPGTATASGVVLRHGEPPATHGVTVKHVTSPGVTQDRWLSTYDGAVAKPVVNAISLPEPNRSRLTIANMLADSPFYWAHRGGSANWVEMTMRAYTNSVFHGAKSLEVSVHRSSDGVFVMHHDPSTLRMTGTDLAIATTPWATLSALTQTSNGQPPEPVQRLELLLDSYGRSHQMSIEDKTYSTVNLNAVLDLIESYYGRAEAIARWIIKFAGISPPGVSGPARSRGYKTWGYYYDDDAVNNMPSTQSSYDYLGLNVAATQANWTAALAYGKRVVAHLVASPADKTTALGKGATGLQCSNVVTVIPKLNTIP